jgi:PAS domain S-box-containing protein
VSAPIDERLKLQIERLEALSAAAFDGIGISQDGKVVEANDQLAALLRCERQDLIGADVASFVAPESRELVSRTMLARQTEPYDHLALRRDGSVFTVEAQAKTIQYRGREARVTALRDVSEQRRLAHAVRSIVEATVVVGEDFFPALVRGVVSALDMEYALIGEPVEVASHPGHAQSPVRVRSVAFWGRGALLETIEYTANNTPTERLLSEMACLHSSDVRARFPDDVLLQSSAADTWLGVPLVSVEGRVIGVLTTWRRGSIDQIELARSILTLFAGRAAAELGRRRSDRALQQSEQSLRATIDATPHVAIQWFDADGRISLWNGASEHIFGWSSSEAVGKTLDELMLDSTQTRIFRDRFAEALQSAQPSEPMEYAFRRRDGLDGRCLSTLFRIPDVGGRARIACIDVDISAWRDAEQQRSELERQLRHAQQLETLGTLTSGIAHDFNNILMAIFAYGELAVLEFDDGEKARQHLSDLQKAALRARDLVRQILGFSRRHAPVRRPVRLQEVVREALDFVRSTFPSTIQIRTAIDEEAPAVQASPIQMHQIVLNLCTNAAQAMPGGRGEIQVLLDPVQIDAADAPAPELTPGQYVRLEISDTGSGIDPETLERVFDPFFTTKARGAGTGIGLAVVSSIVRDHHGAIRVTSAPGRGARFEVYLPARGVASPAVDEALIAPSPGQGERVLVVDDEPALCFAYASMLERQGYRVTSRTDSLLALEAFVAAPSAFDLVVTDLTMPHMSGTELAAKLLKIRPGLPVLLLSGFTEAFAPEQLSSLGLRGFLAKPFLPAALAEAVRRALHASP